MSQVYGPYGATSTPPLAVGTITQISVSQQAGYVTISNQSIYYDMLVDFGVSQPPVVAQAGGASWSHVLHPGDVLDLQLLNPDKTPTPLGLYWSGTVWVLPLTNASQLSVAAQLPTISNFWVTIYAPGEPLGQRATSSPTVSQVGQQRVIGVPMSVVSSPKDFLGIANGSAQDIAAYVIPAALLNMAVTAYLYWADVSFIFTPATGGAYMNMSIQMNVRNSSHVALFGWTDMARFVIGSSAANPSSHWPFMPPQPVKINAPLAGVPTAYEVAFRLFCNAYAGTAGQNLTYTIACDIDTTNSSATPGDIGNAGYFSAVQPNPFLF